MDSYGCARIHFLLTNDQSVAAARKKERTSSFAISHTCTFDCIYPKQFTGSLCVPNFSKTYLDNLFKGQIG
jgi:hypothetical protein